MAAVGKAGEAVADSELLHAFIGCCSLALEVVALEEDDADGEADEHGGSQENLQGDDVGTAGRIAPKGPRWCKVPLESEMMPRMIDGDHRSAETEFEGNDEQDWAGA